MESVVYVVCVGVVEEVREGNTSWLHLGYQPRDSGLRHVKINQVEVSEIATLPKSTTKTLMTIVHWHWAAAKASPLAGREGLGRERGEQSGVLLQHEASSG